VTVTGASAEIAADSRLRSASIAAVRLAGVGWSSENRALWGPMSARTVEVGDGRMLAFEEVGDPAGAPVLVIHGTPGCRLSGRHPDLSRISAAGLRLVTYDRPGYGRSTRQPGRRVVECVSDVAAIADELDIERFAVSGGSGGGPHALAVAARLPERVTRVACVVGFAPYDAEDLDWFAGMDPVNVKEFGRALAGEAMLAPELQRQARESLARVDEDPTALLADVELSESDRAVLSDPGVRETLRAATHEMFAAGALGWVDDDLAFVQPWGFDLQELRAPVEIRYGVTDVLVPAAHGTWLAAHVPGAEMFVDEHGGHLSTPDQRLEMLGTLAVT
jgi:pimeloyl-ACP methyl ester carboxylesterase